MRKPSVLIIFLTVFLDLVGFGIVIPLLPIYAQHFHAAGWELGAIAASFSAMQFFFGPILGRLSDRIGRRPVLLFSTAGASLSYLLFAYASSLDGRTALLWMFLARGFAGICGANITVAQAYIADITPPADRSKKMGLIGMAFGLGFIFGPAISGSVLKYGLAVPGLVAAGLCALNFLLAFAILPESWKPESAPVAPRPHFAQWVHTMTRPKVGLLIAIFFLATFCFTCFEVTLGLLIIKNFPELGTDSAAIGKTATRLFIFAGLIGAFVQGGATGRLVKLMGESKLIALSMFLVAVSLAPMPFATSWSALYVMLAVLSIGSSLTRPPVFGMISKLTPPDEQGVTLGVAQSAGSLARIAGPLFAATLFKFNAPLPYLICGVISLLTGILAWQRLSDGVPATVAATAAAKP